jgi:hypothetical protein
MVADRDLEIDVPRRQQVAYAEQRGLSRRRRWALLCVARSTIGYVSRLVGRDAPVLAPLRTLAGQCGATTTRSAHKVKINSALIKLSTESNSGPDHVAFTLTTEWFSNWNLLNCMTHWTSFAGDQPLIILAAKPSHTTGSASPNSSHPYEPSPRA